MDSNPPPPPPAAHPDPNIIPPDGAKDPVLILLLALFLGAIAYFVLGQWQKGLAGVVAWLCGLAFAIVTCGIGIVVYIPLAITFVVDAYMQADLLKKGHPIGQWTFFSQHA